MGENVSTSPPFAALGIVGDMAVLPVVVEKVMLVAAEAITNNCRTRIFFPAVPAIRTVLVCDAATLAMAVTGVTSTPDSEIPVVSWYTACTPLGMFHVTNPVVVDDGAELTSTGAKSVPSDTAISNDVCAAGPLVYTILQYRLRELYTTVAKVLADAVVVATAGDCVKFVFPESLLTWILKPPEAEA